MCQIVKSLVNSSPLHFSYFKNKEEAHFLLTHMFVETILIYKKNREQKMYECCVHVLCIA
jgi:hypothetical protein